ncbi:glycine oxidase ThiO [Patulibacter minatonensis]|uniref:glycine oxidase ThiO n=1 Tax=Patulibacter minatonensis TaxID=298163 RepID=UPI000561A547|nr:glycine oxidase ThiO [Patulibacter minatonensis]
MPARPSTDRPTDVLVVGAGLAGLPVAWELARRGASVRVVDRGAPGGATSRVAAGMLAPVTETEPDDPGHLAVGRAGLERWPAFAAALHAASGIEVPLHAAGTLALARDRDEAEALGRFADVCARFALPVERLLPSAVRRLEPALAPTLRGALAIPGDAAVDPRVVVRALTGALAGHGVEVVRAGVERLLVDGRGTSRASPADEQRAGARRAPRATGVALDDGRVLRAGAVVLATGAWSVDGVPDTARVPVRPVKGQLLVLRDPSGPGLLERVLRFGTGYVVPRGDGRYVLGATTEERGFDLATTAWALHDLLRDGYELVPGLLDLEVEETLAGLRPTTPDALPAIGPAAGVDALWWATGHHRNGVLLAPLTGAVLAEQIAGAGSSGEPILDGARVAGLVAPARFAVAPDDPTPAVPPAPPTPRPTVPEDARA